MGAYQLSGLRCGALATLQGPAGAPRFLRHNLKVPGGFASPLLSPTAEELGGRRCADEKTPTRPGTQQLRDPAPLFSSLALAVGGDRARRRRRGRGCTMEQGEGGQRAQP